jgi:dTDP-glucose 4,6-dehydratase
LGGAAQPVTRILVTGGAGFVGSHHVRMLLGPDGPPDVAVTVLDRRSRGGDLAHLDEVHDTDRLALVRGDICDSELVGKLVSEHDQVMHFAAESHLDRSVSGAGGFLRTNILGTHTLLDAALRRGLRTFVHISTDEVYGSIRAGSLPENAPLRPDSPYTASKAASDPIAPAHHRTHGLDVRVTRRSTTYGPHQLPEQAVPLFITRLLKGRPVPRYSDGQSVRDWIHIDDHVRAIELVRTCGRPGEVHTIGGDDELSVRELIGMLLCECGAHRHMVHSVADRDGHDRRSSVDFTKGLAETVDRYRTHRSWWEPLLQRGSSDRRYDCECRRS